MRPNLLLLLILSSSLQAKQKRLKKSKAAHILVEQLKLEGERKYRYNPYENIFSGTISFLVGTVGYYSSNALDLKLVYALTQSIGVVTTGYGIHDYYAPRWNHELQQTLSGVHRSRNPRNFIAKRTINFLSAEHEAKNRSIMMTSGMLVISNSANILIDEPPNSLKNIFYFIGGVNLIIFLHSLFNDGPYSKLRQQLEMNKKYSLNVLPTLTPQNNSVLSGIQFKLRF
jgi:hypothetical protein